MKNIIVLGLALLLAGCATPNVFKLPHPAEISSSSDIVINGETIGKAPAPKVPPLPDSLAKKAGPLPPLTDPSVVGQQDDATKTDRLYNDVSHQLNNVIDAWLCVMDALNNQKDATACFKDKVK